MRPLKIAIVTNISWSLYNFRMELARSLKAMGHEVILVAKEDEYSNFLRAEFEYHNIYVNLHGSNPLEDLKTTYAIFKLYKQLKPDIVLQFSIKPNIYGTFAASALSLKIVNNIAGLGSLFVKDNITTKIAKMLYRLSQKRADRIFFQNRDDFELFTSENIVPAEKCKILPGSGVNTAHFVKTPKSVDTGKFVFLLASRMIWEKGVGNFVEAAEEIHKKYPDTEFHLLGAVGELGSNCITKEQIDEWTSCGYIKYLGVTNNIKEFIKEADCVILPSYYREGTPRILLESASMEKPLITTNSVGCKDVVDDGVNGFLCQPRDSKDLQQKIERLLNLTDDERAEMGRAGREKILRQFDEKIVIDEYKAIIEKLCS